jgi:hypothetical protein
MVEAEIIALIKRHWREYQYQQGSHEQKALLERDLSLKDNHAKQAVVNTIKSQVLFRLLAEIDPNEQIWDKKGWYKKECRS